MCVADELKKALKVYSFEFFAIQIKTINLTLVQNEQFCHLHQTLLWLTMIHTKTAVTLDRNRYKCDSTFMLLLTIRTFI